MAFATRSCEVRVSILLYYSAVDLQSDRFLYDGLEFRRGCAHTQTSAMCRRVSSGLSQSSTSGALLQRYEVVVQSRGELAPHSDEMPI